MQFAMVALDIIIAHTDCLQSKTARAIEHDCKKFGKQLTFVDQHLTWFGVDERLARVVGTTWHDFQMTNRCRVVRYLQLLKVYVMLSLSMKI